ncbi:MAG TPA: acyl-CoA dehydrogenase family protein [Ilumatobacter sp.]|nr:acyl-CoA dehydrogenase family protein [Ilumatobacter sp.]
MDLNYPPDAEDFRIEVRAWLARTLPAGWGHRGSALAEPDREQFIHEWPSLLAAPGWRCPSWPTEYGGAGLSLIECVVLEEELARVGAPEDPFPVGAMIVGPTIMHWGTPAQKQYFLPEIARGTIAWCQGFSEPDAGSDLASLRTTAVLTGDEWLLNGQKIWTSRAHAADYAFVLARTDPAAPSHAGLSYLLVPMGQLGIEIRPIVQIDGSADFNEVFFSDARCPADNVVGGVNNGWKVAMTTLGFERGAASTTSHRRFADELDDVLELARTAGLAGDPLFRQRWARQWSRVQILRFNGLRVLADLLHGGRQGATVGPISKIAWSETHRDTLDLALDVLGAEALVLAGGATADRLDRRRGMRRYPVSPVQSTFFFSRSTTIWGGTSEIQRNIVAERVLGLPKEPRPQLSRTE